MAKAVLNHPLWILATNGQHRLNTSVEILNNFLSGELVVDSIPSKVKAHLKFLYMHSNRLSTRTRKACVQPLYYVTLMILVIHGMLASLKF